MSGKFAMKLVIDDVTSPLLYARLSAVGSPRGRAALLRSIAEAACRGEPSALPSPDTVPYRTALMDSTTTDAGSGQLASVPPLSLQVTPEPMPYIGSGHDTASIAEEFAGYF